MSHIVEANGNMRIRKSNDYRLLVDIFHSGFYDPLKESSTMGLIQITSRYYDLAFLSRERSYSVAEKTNERNIRRKA